MASLPTLNPRLEPAAPRPEGYALADLKIGDLAKVTGKTARALRLYEELGLLTPGTRTAGGFRVYGAEAIERVRWIGQLQDLGFTLHDIQAAAQTMAHTGVPREAMSSVRRMFTDKLTDVAEQIRRLQGLQRELASALAYLESCQGCGLESHAAAAAAAKMPCLRCAEHGDERAPPLIKGLTETAAEAKEPGLPPDIPDTQDTPSSASGRNR